MNARSRFSSALRGLPVPPRRVLVAVSGGADSVALLRLFVSIREEMGLALFAAHMEHGIRGEASRADCAFVEALCGALGVPLTVRRADVPAQAALAREGIETCARRLRHEFLEETRHALGADAIALAHHADDQAETVLMHLLRGSGLGGASAMKPASGHIIRPLLGFTRAEIEEYLAEIGQDFRTDATNAVCDNPRNALRQQVFPLLTAIYPGASQALSRFAAIAADEDAFLAAQTETLWSERAESYAGVCVLRGVDEIEPCLLRRLIRRALPNLGLSDVERAMNSAHAQLSGGAESWKIAEDLYLSETFSAPEEAPLSEACALPGICELRLMPSLPVPEKDDPFSEVVPASALTGAVLRTRRAGDFIRPFGLHGRKKSFSDYLTDRKFPLPLRDRLPVVARGSEILWAAGLGLSETLRITGDEAAVKLQITINGSMKWRTNKCRKI